MRGVPGAVTAAVAIGKAYLRVGFTGAGFERALHLLGGRVGVARPVVTRVVEVRRVGCAVGLGARQNLVAVGVGCRAHILPVGISRIWVVVEPRHNLSLLRESRPFVQIVTEARLLDRVAVQMCDVARDHDTVDVVPWPRANPIARVNGRSPGARLRAEVCTPGLIACTDGCSELFTVSVGAGQSAEVAAVTDRLTRHEECHGCAARHTVLSEHRGRYCENDHEYPDC